MRRLLRISQALLCAGVCFSTFDCLAQNVAAAPVAVARQDEMRHIAFVGKTLAEVQQLEFFSFFHLEKVREWQDPSLPGVTITMFGQNGNFRNQVFAGIITNTEDGRIVHASVSVSRQFIDSPQTTVFARDFVKSFLEMAPEPAPVGLKGLWNEVWHGCSSNANAYDIGPDGKLTPKTCQMEGEASQAYRVYLGKDTAYRLESPGAASVLLHNATQGSANFLQVDIGKE